MSSKGFERWLISRIDMPTPGSETRSRCACSRTSSGRIAGPAEKLKIRVVVTITPPLRKSYDPYIENVRILGLDQFAKPVGRSPIQIDSRNGCFRPLEHDVFRFLNVEMPAPQVIEHVRKHSRPVAVPDHEHVGGGRPRREVHDVRHLSGFGIAADDSH